MTTTTTRAVPATPPDAGLARIQRRTLAVLVAAQVVGGAGVTTGVAIAALSAARLSGSDLIGGLALTCTVLGAALAAVPLARAATRFGRRTALLGGWAAATAGAAGGTLAMVLGSWPLLLLSCVPFGTGTAAGLAARFAGTDLAAPGRRARALAVVLAATTVGAVCGPLLAAPAQRGAGAAGLVPGAGPYLLCTVLFGAAAAIVAAGLRPDPLRLARTHHSAADPGPGEPGTGTPIAPLALALGVVVVAQLVMIAVMSMAPVHMTHGGAGLGTVGLAIGAHAAGMYALSPLFGWASDRLGRLPVLAAGAGLLVAAGLVAGTADPHDHLRLTAGLVLLGLGWSAALVAGSALLVDAVPPAERPRLQGRADIVVNLSGALGGSVAGVTVAATSYEMLALGCAGLAGGVLVAVLRRALPRVGSRAPHPPSR
ncbi:MFS transporter [Pseudonocardia kujensis]|uniref:MFS transporter n=1 Tax=Pseudonocardia kujensis TaxID=1128675 RepID=UPI001E2BA326|nr:MFS transporter [Pseudonocardia kujensis]MCE0767896.1 MFS transporter [Pseudonocardia kujensis]